MHPASDAYTISLVEDEDVLRDEMAFQLGHHGFQVESFEDAAGFYRYLAIRPRTIAVLDIGLKGEDGLSICRHLRQHDHEMGIVFLTARSLRADRLAGLEAGADAYLVKPVDIDELVLVLRRLALRFERSTPAPPPAPPPAAASVGGWRMASGSGFLQAPNGIRTRISVNEGQLLNVLFRKNGEPCTHVELAVALGLHPDDHDKHRIEVILSRLRSKVLRSTGMALPVVALRGLGYSLSPAAPVPA